MIGPVANRLKSVERPIDLILAGLGFMGYGFLRRARQTPGFRVPLVISRNATRATALLRGSGMPCQVTASPARVEANADRGIISICCDYGILGSLPYPIVVEMAGEVIYGAEVAVAAMGAKKHLVTMNAGLQVTVGSKLLRCARAQGLNLTDSEGDQPGSLAAMVEEARFIGFRPLMVGNMKRFLDRHATPATLGAEAARRGISLPQVTAFTDGSKIALEMTLIANYLGMKCLTRGMYGYQAESVQQTLTLYEWANVPREGFVDYIIGPDLFPGILTVCEHEDPGQAGYLEYLGFGKGPQYLLYRPYHLCHLETLSTVARVALFQENTINNSLAPTTQTVAVAKRDLEPGERLDGIGGYCCYGVIENQEAVDREEMVPLGLVEGALVRRQVKQDRPIGWDDVELPNNIVTRMVQEKRSSNSSPGQSAPSPAPANRTSEK